MVVYGLLIWFSHSSCYRLGLERGKTAKEAVEVITSLLEAHGQGGPCFIDPGYVGMTYHNSFLIADPSEAWVLETAGKHWAVEQVTGKAELHDFSMCASSLLQKTLHTLSNTSLVCPNLLRLKVRYGF